MFFSATVEMVTGFAIVPLKRKQHTKISEPTKKTFFSLKIQ